MKGLENTESAKKVLGSSPSRVTKRKRQHDLCRRFFIPSTIRIKDSFYPNATSSTIIRTKPAITPHVPQCWLSERLASGIRSSATTNTMAPAAKANSQG